jgi:hypothetical protein
MRAKNAGAISTHVALLQGTGEQSRSLDPNTGLLEPLDARAPALHSAPVSRHCSFGVGSGCTKPGVIRKPSERSKTGAVWRTQLSPRGEASRMRVLQTLHDATQWDAAATPLGGVFFTLLESSNPGLRPERVRALWPSGGQRSKVVCAEPECMALLARAPVSPWCALHEVLGCGAAPKCRRGAP